MEPRVAWDSRERIPGFFLVVVAAKSRQPRTNFVPNFVPNFVAHFVGHFVAHFVGLTDSPSVSV